MTSLVNNSNQNSALINTINSSQSKFNPNIYSTKAIYPASAVTYVKTQKSSGSFGANQTMMFDLMKYGIAQQILLCYTKVGDANTTIGAFDFLDVIDRVELLSSSKVIDTLTNHDLLAQFSDLDTSQYNIVSRSCVKERAAAASQQFVIPLRFGLLSDINTQLNLQFNEPMSIRVRFGPSPLQVKAGTVVTIADDDVFLKMRYKAYNESDFSEILAENYNEPELNQMSTGYYDENAVTQKLTAAANGDLVIMPLTGLGAKVELKNTDCVNDFYVMVRRQGVPTNGNYEPVQINRIRMTASGQEIFDLDGVELFYSKLCKNGFSVLTSSASTDKIVNVCKIQTGLWEYAGGGTQSNTLSLRELNNPIVEVWFQDTVTAANTPQNYDVIVVEDAVKVYATTSSTGRLAVALTN